MDRRAWIMEAATTAFAQYGYKATTMELVSKIANVGKGTIYTFFATKEQLFEEILQHALGQMRAILEKTEETGGRFFDRLVRALDALLDFRKDHELFVKLAQEVRDVGTQQALEGIRRLELEARAYLRRSIESGMRSGELRPCDSDIVAFMILRMYIDLTMEWGKTAPPLTKRQIIDNMQLLLTEGLIRE
ncbi:TetR/AcrR family transcriptional regulator [Paenibacillus antri]|uniref:TetR/AcrR family transcriptional regulator n=1 Tax=Paenibacillus antri TaxID=2582848 RepID=A0A5R9GGN2_9BACL|nr:TetR/AcrR family transcriptional regulator [Paenibacillus antri]TLS53586.1 TetR/AcrR family transcriptional regulator [Paenibacillus antri]